MKALLEWTGHALDFDEALKLPMGINIRQLKAGIKLAGRLCRCKENISKMMMVRGHSCLRIHFYEFSKLNLVNSLVALLH